MVLNLSEPARNPHKRADLHFTPPHAPYSCSGLTPAQTSENEDEGRVLPIICILCCFNPILQLGLEHRLRVCIPSTPGFAGKASTVEVPQLALPQQPAEPRLVGRLGGGWGGRG